VPIIRLAESDRDSVSPNPLELRGKSEMEAAAPEGDFVLPFILMSFLHFMQYPGSTPLYI